MLRSKFCKCPAKFIYYRFYNNDNKEQFENVLEQSRGGSRAAATSKMERFVIIVNGWKLLTVITECSILDVAAALGPLLQRLVSLSNFEESFDTFLATLNEHAPLKKKKIRYNRKVFMSKTLRKLVMKRSKLRNTFNKKRSSENWQNYKRQRNICSNILKSTKNTFFETLNIIEITDNRKFWIF